MCILRTYYYAVRTVAAAAAAAAAVRRCTPATRGVFHTAAVVTINLYCYLYERKFFTVEADPLAEQSLLCGLGFTYYSSEASF